MKRTLSLLIVILVLLPVTLMLSGCSKEEAKVESLMEIDSSFSGHREITVVFPHSVDVESLIKTLDDNNPLLDSKKSEFEYVGVEEAGHTFVMDLVFDSKDEYLSQVKKLTGKKAASYLSLPDSVLSKGVRMTENFDSLDLIKWIIDVSRSNENTRDIQFDFSDGAVAINENRFKTGKRIDVAQLKGEPVESVVVETANLKDGTFDRTISVLMPYKTYIDNSKALNEYFKTRTSPKAHYCDFSSKGESWEYKVIYKGITIDELSQYTSMLLGSSDEGVLYEDKNDISTPLSEGFVFEETINTFNFVTADGGCVDIEYRYSLPTNTTHSDGAVNTDGSWKAEGMWQDGIYSVNVDSDIVSIRIPDGIEYDINGIRFDLEILEDNNFVRTVELLYSKSQGADGVEYAYKYFKEKGAQVSTDKDEKNLICKVVCKGDAQHITDELVKYFGDGNFLAYEVDDSMLALSEKTKLTDYIDLSGMLDSTNANRPMTYSVHSSCKENVVGLMCDGVESVYENDEDGVLTVSLENGIGTIVYNGSNPDVTNIMVYVIVGLVMLGATVVLIAFMLRKQHKKSCVESFDVSYVPQQTTTFSISELTALADKTDEKLRAEIDRDVREKMEADRIYTLSKQLKEKELEQLVKMVYGNDAAISKSAEQPVVTDEQDEVYNEEANEETKEDNI